MNSFEKPSPQKIENPYIFIPESNEIDRLSIYKAIYITFAPIFFVLLSIAYPNFFSSLKSFTIFSSYFSSSYNINIILL